MPPLTEIAGEKIELQDAYAHGVDPSLSEINFVFDLKLSFIWIFICFAL